MLAVHLLLLSICNAALLVQRSRAVWQKSDVQAVESPCSTAQWTALPQAQLVLLT